MITQDSWQRIKEIFYSAQELTPAERPDYLDKACGDDQSIREEVEALLIADTSNDTFLSAPAYEFAAPLFAEERSEFSAGQKVGRYEILCPLGAGGMGQIYLAKDPELHRNIALKLISPEFAHDARRVHRFEQEARAASALNHPNICVIHEIGVTESGRHFIAMEFIQGTTLREKLSRGALTARETLHIAIQVATALASAHASRIVHRDIKPENIMVRPDGYVKVLDFGLAKLTEIIPGLPDVSTNVRTETGMLMGTVKYMSPEQLRESKVDERTDIWSFGIVLYEMLTGVTPFDARTSNDTVAAILAPQPAPLKFPPEIPKPLQEIISKALAKECDARYQTVTKLAADLKKIESKLPPPIDPPPIQPPGIISRLKSQAVMTTGFIVSEIRSHKTATAAVFAATGVLALLLLLPSVTRFVNTIINPPGIHTLEMKLVTNAGTSVWSASAISHNGELVAHAEEKDGKQSLVLTSLVTSTSDQIVPPANVQYLGISFTRDSNYLYFTRTENGAGSLYRLARPGGIPFKIKDSVDSPISLSPQEDQFAFVRHNRDTGVYSLIVSSIDGSTERVLATRQDGDAFSVYGLAWSPDGSLVVCPTSSWTGGYKVNLIGFDVNNGTTQPIGNEAWFGILGIGWQDEMSSLVISARERATMPFRLWRLTYPDGVAQQITMDPTEYRGVSLAGQDIVTVRRDISWDLIVTTAANNYGKPRNIASGSSLNYGISWAGDSQVVFSSMVQGSLIISRVDVNDFRRVQLTLKAGDDYTPAVSSDGSFVVFASNRNGKANIWRMNTEDGSDLKQLTSSDGNYYPHISPDDRWVAYDNQEKGKLAIWKVPLQGGAPIKIADRYRMPVFSPNSRLIAARYDADSSTNDLAIFSAEDGELLQRVALPNLEWQRVYWLSDRVVSYIDNADGYANIWSHDLDTGAKKKLTNFNSKQIFAYAWSPDYKSLAVQLGTTTRDVVKIRP